MASIKKTFNSQKVTAFVFQAWRHGDRGPDGNYPTDPNGEDKWRYGWKELTPV